MDVRVLKWPVSFDGPFTVPGRRVVFFAAIHGGVSVWTECYISDDLTSLVDDVSMDLVVIGTGHGFSGKDKMNHLMSCMEENGRGIWHLYEKIRRRSSQEIWIT